MPKYNDRHILSWHHLLYLSESCNPLPLLSNGKIHNNGVSHGAVVSFSCNSGFLADQVPRWDME